MRELVLSMGVSLDGLVARPGGYRAGDWGLPPEDPALAERDLRWMDDIGLHVMGRRAARLPSSRFGLVTRMT
jgi:hypothetical protein